jgi:RNA polymerase sigma-70 factor, ECF subfamily
MDPEAKAPAIDVTQLLQAWNAGNQDACAQVIAFAYQQVHRIAQNALQQNPGATLTPTELSNEALLKLLNSAPDFINRKHFFGVIAQAVRQVLVDAARKRMAAKRGAAAELVSLTDANHQAFEVDETLLKLDLALDALKLENPRRAELIELLYFGGFSQNEVAQSLGLSLSTIERDLRFARAWLKVAIGA